MFLSVFISAAKAVLFKKAGSTYIIMRFAVRLTRAAGAEVRTRNEAPPPLTDRLRRTRSGFSAARRRSPRKQAVFPADFPPSDAAPPAGRSPRSARSGSPCGRAGTADASRQQKEKRRKGPARKSRRAVPRQLLYRNSSANPVERRTTESHSSSSRKNHFTEPSRRNHVSWRFAYLRVERFSVSTHSG